MSASTDINSSSLQEVKVCALNKQQNVDLTTVREKTGTKGQRKEMTRDIMLEKKTNCYEIQDTYTETLKEVLNYLNGR